MSAHRASCEDMDIVQGHDWELHEFKDAIFVMGTHYLFNTWLIISIII